jgi:hypothetical protein
MFGKQSMQVVSLNDLTEFVKGVFPAALQPAQPQYMPQPQQPSGTTTVTIYIQELHIHQEGSQDEARLLPGRRMAELSAPSQAASYTLPEYAIDQNVEARPPALRCTHCGNGIPNCQEVRYRGMYFHQRCYQMATEENQNLPRY